MPKQTDGCACSEKACAIALRSRSARTSAPLSFVSGRMSAKLLSPVRHGVDAALLVLASATTESDLGAGGVAPFSSAVVHQLSDQEAERTASALRSLQLELPSSPKAWASRFCSSSASARGSSASSVRPPPRRCINRRFIQSPGWSRKRDLCRDCRSSWGCPGAKTRRSTTVIERLSAGSSLLGRCSGRMKEPEKPSRSGAGPRRKYRSEPLRRQYLTNGSLSPLPLAKGEKECAPLRGRVIVLDTRSGGKMQRKLQPPGFG